MSRLWQLSDAAFARSVRHRKEIQKEVTYYQIFLKMVLYHLLLSRLRVLHPSCVINIDCGEIYGRRPNQWSTL